MPLLSPKAWTQSIARHRLFAAAALTLIVLAVGAIVLSLIDSGHGATTLSGAVIATATPTSVVTTPFGNDRSVVGRTNRIAAVRTAPGSHTPVLGTLGRGETVEIDGKSAGDTWLRIVFPPESTLHGWVDAKMVDLAGDLALVAVATPDPPVVVSVPTTPRRSSTTVPARATVSATQRTESPPTRTATSSPIRTAVPSWTPTAKAAGRRP